MNLDDLKNEWKEESFKPQPEEYNNKYITEPSWMFWGSIIALVVIWLFWFLKLAHNPNVMLGLGIVLIISAMVAAVPK